MSLSELMIIAGLGLLVWMAWNHTSEREQENPEEGASPPEEHAV